MTDSMFDDGMRDMVHEWLSSDEYDLLNAVIQDYARYHDLHMLERDDLTLDQKLNYADVAARLEDLRQKIFGQYIDEVG